jgi:hypothetical protein
MIGSTRTLNRQVFQQYRTQLDANDFLRTNPAYGSPEHRSAPPPRVSPAFSLHGLSESARKHIRSSIGVSDMCAFDVLPYWNTQKRSRLDAMHIFKGVMKHIMYFAKGKRYPKGDVDDSEQDLQLETNRKLDHFRLSSKQQSEADKRFSSVRGPPGYLARTKQNQYVFELPVLDRSLLFLVGTVSARHWQNVAEYVAPLVLWDLPDELFYVTMDMLRCLHLICARRLTVRELPALRQRVLHTW